MVCARLDFNGAIRANPELARVIGLTTGPPYLILNAPFDFSSGCGYFEQLIIKLAIFLLRRISASLASCH